MGGVPSLQDFSPVAGCSVLERISIIPGNPRGLQDASFLGGLKKLIDIDLIGANLPSLDFLNQLAEGRSLLPRFHLSGSAGDYSGLDAFQTYETLELENDGGLSVEQVAPYLEGKTVSKLSLSRFDNPDLSLLPVPQLNLTLERCNIPDLSILPEDWDMQDLSLRNCMVLSSLEGLGGQSGFGMKGGHFFPLIFACTCMGFALGMFFFAGDAGHAAFAAGIITAAALGAQLKKPLAVTVLLLLCFPPQFLLWGFLSAAAGSGLAGMIEKRRKGS